MGDEPVETPRTRPASDVQVRRVEWLWQHRIPRGKITLLEGDPGLGKTTILLDLAARTSSGRSMPGDTSGRAAEHAGVVYLSAEDDDGDTIRPRLEAAEADLDRVHLWADASLPMLPEDINIIGKVIVANDAQLVVFDPGVAFLGGEGDGNRDANVRQALAPLRGVCEQTGAAAVLLRHLNKNANSGNALYRGGGSIAWIAAARSALLSAKDPDDHDQMVLACTKANLGPQASSLAYRLQPVEVAIAGTQVRIEWLGESDHDAHDLLEPKRQGRSEKREACAEWLREKLANGNMVARKALVTEAAPRFSEHLIKRAGKDIGVIARRENVVQGGTLWSLK